MEKAGAVIMFVIALTCLFAVLFWFRELGKIGLLLSISGAALFGQLGWNLWHKELDKQDHLLK